MEQPQSAQAHPMPLSHRFSHIEHIGIAVKDMEQAIARYTQLLGCPPYKTEEVAQQHVLTVFFKVGNTKIELLQATQAGSVIDKYVQKYGEGMHHIAYAVKNIKKEMEALAQLGFTLLNDTPQRGADNKLVCFIHPKTINGVLTELCQEREQKSEITA